MKLLLDPIALTTASPKVALELSGDGVDICLVRDRGLLAATDAEVMECAFAEDRVLVTANVCDFVALTRARELHAGVILLEDGIYRLSTSLESHIRLVAPASKCELDRVGRRAVWRIAGRDKQGGCMR